MTPLMLMVFLGILAAVAAAADADQRRREPDRTPEMRVAPARHPTKNVAEAINRSPHDKERQSHE